MTLEDLAFPPTVQDDLQALQKCAGAAGPAGVAAHARNLLALDLGTYTGWAVQRRDGSISYGTEHFIQRNQWHDGQRFVNFRAWLGDLLTREQIHHIVYERVVFGHSSSQASNVYGAFWGQVLACAAVRNIECQGVAVPTVKKHWARSGRAKKPDMIDEAKRRGFRPDSDNSADALAILHWAIKQESE